MPADGGPPTSAAAASPAGEGGGLGAGSLRELARHFVSDGWCHVPRLGVDEETLRSARAEAADLDANMRPGRGTNGYDMAQYVLRSDRVLWLHDIVIADRPALRSLVAAIEDFVGRLAQQLGQSQLQLRLTGREAPMLATYDPGAFFRRHVDATEASTGNRILTAVYYPNPAWDAEKGGELRLNPGSKCPIDVLPEEDSLVIFRADEVEHEVRVAHAKRWAITLWFRGTCRAVDSWNIAGAATPLQEGLSFWRVACGIALRAQHRATAKVVAMLKEGDEVATAGAPQGDWLRVVSVLGRAETPPEAWVLRDASDYGLGAVLEELSSGPRQLPEVRGSS